LFKYLKNLDSNLVWISVRQLKLSNRLKNNELYTYMYINKGYIRSTNTCSSIGLRLSRKKPRDDTKAFIKPGDRLGAAKQLWQNR